MKHLVWMPLLATAILVHPDLAAAEENQAVLTAAQMLDLEEAYRREGRDADADALLDFLLHDHDIQVRAEARFRLGQSRLARGDYDAAIDQFEALLEEQPNAQPVRLALARALTLAGRTASAARELRRAESGGLPPDVQRLVDRFSDVLRRSRPYGVNVELGLAPDSNINQATSSESIEIGGLPLALDDSGRATSGMGLIGSVDAFVTLPLTEGVKAVTRVAAAGNFYRRDRFDDIVASASSGPEFSVGRVVTRVAATYSWRSVGNRRYSEGLGGSLQLLAPLGRGSQVGATIALSDQHYRIAEQSGRQFTGSLSYERAFTARLYGRAEATFGRADAGADAYATTSFGGAVSVSRDAGAMTVYARAAYTRTDGDGPFVLFGAARADDRFDLSMGSSINRWSIAGLKPVVRIQQTFNRSPLDLYQFKRTRLELSLTERF